MPYPSYGARRLKIAKRRFSMQKSFASKSWPTITRAGLPESRDKRRGWELAVQGDEPCVSTFIVLDDKTVAFDEIRKGYRFASMATMFSHGNGTFDALLGHFSGPLAQRMRAIVTITVTKAPPLTSSAYARISTLSLANRTGSNW
jgi:hypothetical protein